MTDGNPDDGDDPLDDLVTPDEEDQRDEPAGTSNDDESASTSNVDEPDDATIRPETPPESDRESGIPSEQSRDHRDSDGDRRGPLGDLAASIDERRNREASEADELFVEEDVQEVDADAVWNQLENGGTEDATGAEEREYRVVDKSKFCERCEYLSTPEELRCTHDGTDIVELVDLDRLRVVDCPKVLEQERLERL